MIIKLLLNLPCLLRVFYLKLRRPLAVQINGHIRLHKNISFNIRNGKLKIGKNLNIYPNSHIGVIGGNLEIGDYVFFNRNCIIACHKFISIGDHCIFGPNVTIYDHDHKFNHEGYQPGYKTANVVIGEKCWIGAGAIILRGASIGKGCIIGAGAVVKGNIPPYSLVTAQRQLQISPLEKREN